METREAYMVNDLGNGDCGKGQMTNYLVRTRRAHTVIRIGGPQAAHNVYADDGRHHTFSQFGSGSFMPNVQTFLSRFMLLSPLAMMAEAATLRRKGVSDILRRTFISANALTITPFQRAANRLRELARGDARHGSVGMGIGETVKDSIDDPTMALRAGDLLDIPLTGRKLRMIWEKKRAEIVATMHGHPDAAQYLSYFEDRRMIGMVLELFSEFARTAQIVPDEHLKEILGRGTVVFESSQGVRLDEWRGFHPYTTYGTCTFEPAMTLLDECGHDGERHRIGVVRAYAVRHGPGPFMTEDAELTAALPDAHNVMHDWQRQFRVGHFDCVATRYAIAACGGVDALAVTCLDRIHEAGDCWSWVDDYELLPQDGDGALFERRNPHSQNLVSDIKLGPPRDLDHQERLAKRLLAVHANVRRSKGSDAYETEAERHVRPLQHLLRVPVRFTSFGPTAKDVQERSRNS